MIQIKYLEYANDVNCNWEAYGSLCRWSTHGRWRGFPIIEPAELDPLWNDENSIVNGHYPEVMEDAEWFAVTVVMHPIGRKSS